MVNLVQTQTLIDQMTQKMNTIRNDSRKRLIEDIQTKGIFDKGVQVGLICDQIAGQRIKLAQQEMIAQEYFPELAAQFQEKDKALGYKQDMIRFTYQFGGNTKAAKKIADLDRYISDLEFAMQKNARRRTELAQQIQTAPNSESAEQYRTIDKRFETQMFKLESQLKEVQQKRNDLMKEYSDKYKPISSSDEISDANSSAQSQNQSACILSLLMSLITGKSSSLAFNA